MLPSHSDVNNLLMIPSDSSFDGAGEVKTELLSVGAGVLKQAFKVVRDCPEVASKRYPSPMERMFCGNFMSPLNFFDMTDKSP
jgi:hypothetical protein